MKEYIHHPETIPLQVKEVNCRACENCHEDIANGLSFSSNVSYLKGSALNIKIVVEGQTFEALAKVTKVRSVSDKYEVYIDFDEKIDPFQIKMIQQICQIVDYGFRKGITQELAANEWIKDNAEKFNCQKYNTPPPKKRRASVAKNK